MLISGVKVNDVLKLCGYPEVSAHLVAIVAIGVSSVVQDRNEAAMFLAHLIHGSSGFRQREEIDSSTPFHGRGFIQLSREDSYREASQELNGEEQALVDDPDIVTQDAWQAMKVSVWLWKCKVQRVGGPSENKFRRTTMEGPGPGHPTAELLCGLSTEYIFGLDLHRFGPNMEGTFIYR
ncbi:conserved hypothetical protein [Culex quinquefasciatus]|uniref:Glycoside hydrolase family 19 catalytic domain-containing protein n=1 Tax=Culex quinquefasciatus TaxID=7176 RepID=B0WRN2_CULQU|nr:conserved hypothetical protein [Culex quinquefasciatus]|eukprot:XP_001851366.1 conserved hypothetical protein [Culex quinquefasciatus]